MEWRGLERPPFNKETTVKQSFLALFAAFAATAAVTAPATAADLSGAGATFPYPVYAKWADTYKKETNVGLNYQSIGSGGGIKQIQANTVQPTSPSRAKTSRRAASSSSRPSWAASFRL